MLINTATSRSLLKCLFVPGQILWVVDRFVGQLLQSPVVVRVALPGVLAQNSGKRIGIRKASVALVIEKSVPFQVVAGKALKRKSGKLNNYIPGNIHFYY